MKMNGSVQAGDNPAHGDVNQGTFGIQILRGNECDACDISSHRGARLRVRGQAGQPVKAESVIRTCHDVMGFLWTCACLTDVSRRTSRQMHGHLVTRRRDCHGSPRNKLLDLTFSTPVIHHYSVSARLSFRSSLLPSIF